MPELTPEQKVELLRHWGDFAEKMRALAGLFAEAITGLVEARGPLAEAYERASREATETSEDLDGDADTPEGTETKGEPLVRILHYAMTIIVRNFEHPMVLEPVRVTVPDELDDEEALKQIYERTIENWHECLAKNKPLDVGYVEGLIGLVALSPAAVEAMSIFLVKQIAPEPSGPGGESDGATP